MKPHDLFLQDLAESFGDILSPSTVIVDLPKGWQVHIMAMMTELQSNKPVNGRLIINAIRVQRTMLMVYYICSCEDSQYTIVDIIRKWSDGMCDKCEVCGKPDSKLELIHGTLMLRCDDHAHIKQDIKY